MTIKPRALKPGDTLAVVSPSSPIEEDKLHKGLSLLHERGFKTKIFPHALDKNDYLAGRDADRAADLMAAFADPEVDAVYCSRGGYGCARILPYIDLDLMANSRKMLIGFSDITTLHMALQKRGAVSIHAPMALTLAYDREPWVIESFFRVIQGDIRVPDEAKTGKCVVPGQAEGELVGGCMCLICDSIGTPNEINTEGKILLIEDVDENPHRIDAMLTHLLNSGKLQAAAGVVMGEMTRTDDKVDETIGGKPWRTIVSERLKVAGVPSMLDYPFGHMSTMLTIPLGVLARMNADTGILEVLENPCED